MLDNRTITMLSKASSQDPGSKLSLGPTRGSKSKGKIDNSIHPPHSGVPFEFVRNEDDLFIVRSQQRDEMWKRTSKEEELVKYMSKVPSYLQSGEKLEDNNNNNVFSFGVLDWRRLEQWTQKREKVLANEKITRLSNGSCSSSFSEQSNMSNFSNLGPKIGSSNGDGELPKCSQVFDEYCSSKPEGEGIIVLLPNDFSGSGSIKEHRRGSLDEKGGDYNWGSFSDIPHSCPLNFGVDLEEELDLKLDTLVKSKGVEIPVNLSDIPLHNAESKFEVESSSLTVSKESMNRYSHRFSNEIGGDSSIHRRISSSLARVTRSLSFREGSGQPRFSSSFMTAKSGPTKPDDLSPNSEPRNSNKASVSGRVKVSPLRRLLDPLLKSKIVDQIGERSNSNDLILKRVPTLMNEKHEPSIIKAVLHLTVKNGLPLFKFVVGRNDEIFASTVTSLRTLGKNEDDMSLLYTFYSVQKNRKHSNNSWKRNHQKIKPCELGYNIVGQMKVSNGTNMVKESVLYNVEVSNENGLSSEFKTSREMAAIVVNMGDVCRGKKVNDWFCNDLEENKVGHIVVLLPGGDHSLPHDGVPSSLISRWRNGGLCDCGGWDIGCKLRVLSEKWQEHKYFQVQCDLYEQGEAKQHSPLFSLIPLQDELFSVQYDSQISSLQAFSISVSLINSHIHTPSYSTDSTRQFESQQELGSGKASMAEGREKHARHPPLSPVGRV